MSAYELAPLNIGIIRGAIDSPVMAEFVANLDRINALAETSPGFIWRLQTEAGNATAIRPFENESIAVNMSVWRDVESLNAFVYRSAHMEIIDEAIARLEVLRANGPTAEAFTFRESFPPPDAPQSERSPTFGDECPAT
jgi:uncharacterized protein DUF3291